MQLSSEHIDQLYKFTRAHYVEWYDLQTELVDHLANDIESIWGKEPQLTFDEAKSKAFKKFGIFGFSDVIAKKQNSLSKLYWKLVWQIFKEFFTPPKILLTFLIFGIIYLIFNQIEYKEYLLVAFISLIYFTIFIFLYKNHKRNKESFIKSGKKWLIQENIKTFGGFIPILNLPIIFLSLIYDKQIWTQLNIFIGSIVIVFIGLTVYILTQVLPLKLEVKITILYPDYKLYKKA